MAIPASGHSNAARGTYRRIQRKSSSPMNAQVLPGMGPRRTARQNNLPPQQALRLQLALPNTGRAARRPPFIHQHWVIHHGNVEKYPAACCKSFPPERIHDTGLMREPQLREAKAPFASFAESFAQRTQRKPWIDSKCATPRAPAPLRVDLPPSSA